MSKSLISVHVLCAGLVHCLYSQCDLDFKSAKPNHGWLIKVSSILEADMAAHRREADLWRSPLEEHLYWVVSAACGCAFQRSMHSQQRLLSLNGHIQ